MALDTGVRASAEFPFTRGSGAAAVSKGKAFPETCTGGCGPVVRCIDGAPSPSASLWKKSSLQQGQGEGCLPELVLPVEVQSRPAAASLACAPSCGPLLGFGIQAPSWRPWREQEHLQWGSGEGRREGGRACQLFCSPGVIIWRVDLGWAWCFFKRSSQLLKLEQASCGSAPPG